MSIAHVPHANKHTHLYTKVKKLFYDIIITAIYYNTSYLILADSLLLEFVM